MEADSKVEVATTAEATAALSERGRKEEFMAKKELTRITLFTPLVVSPRPPPNCF
jgi:hypothetical protein